MPSRTTGSAHDEAVSRRLALLSAELAGVRGEPGHSDTHIRTLTPALDPPRGPAPGAVDADGPEARDPAPHAVPLPGRHASRRLGGALDGVLPPALRGRFALGPGQVAVVAVLVATGMAVTCWWVVRGDAAPVAAPTTVSSVAPLTSGAVRVSSAATAPASVADPGASPAAELVVDVTGRVRRPGIAVLEPGSRVVDALKAAGGARPGVDLRALNLARPLVDGEQIVVGVAAPPGVAASLLPSMSSTADASGGAIVDLNTADQTTLESLPDVGPVTAQAILAWRADHGRFTSVDELLEVDGIGETTLAKLAPYVTV